MKVLFSILLFSSFQLNIGAQCISSFAAGHRNNLIIKDDGTLWSWGLADWYCLGDGNLSTDVSQPFQLGNANNWKGISGGGQHMLAVDSTGKLYTWGTGLRGQLGLGNSFSYSEMQLQGIWELDTEIDAGLFSTTFLKSDGSLWSCGRNESGEQGIGNTIQQNSPVQVGEETNWDKIKACWYFSLSIKTDGTLWSWGWNFSGELGLGYSSIVGSYIPVQVGIENNWMSVSGSRNSLALKTDGTMWSWGPASNGSLGLGESVNYDVFGPTQVGTDTDWSTISCGPLFAFALKENGTLWGWGLNSTGQLGTGDLENRYVPTQMGADSNWVAVSCGEAHVLAMKEDGTLWSWGYNVNGQLGLGFISEYELTPMQIDCNAMISKTSEQFLAQYDVEVFPNPCNGLFTLKTNSTQPSEVLLFDVLGNTISKRTLTGQLNELYFDLKPGVYILNIDQAGHHFTEKIVVE